MTNSNIRKSLRRTMIFVGWATMAILLAFLFTELSIWVTRSFFAFINQGMQPASLLAREASALVLVFTEVACCLLLALLLIPRCDWRRQILLVPLLIPAAVYALRWFVGKNGIYLTLLISTFLVVWHFLYRWHSSRRETAGRDGV